MNALQLMSLEQLLQKGYSLLLELGFTPEDLTSPSLPLMAHERAAVLLRERVWKREGTQKPANSGKLLAEYRKIRIMWAFKESLKLRTEALEANFYSVYDA